MINTVWPLLVVTLWYTIGCDFPKEKFILKELFISQYFVVPYPTEYPLLHWLNMNMKTLKAFLLLLLLEWMLRIWIGVKHIDTNITWSNNFIRAFYLRYTYKNSIPKNTYKHYANNYMELYSSTMLYVHLLHNVTSIQCSTIWVRFPLE